MSLRRLPSGQLWAEPRLFLSELDDETREHLGAVRVLGFFVRGRRAARDLTPAGGG